LAALSGHDKDCAYIFWHKLGKNSFLLSIIYSFLATLVIYRLMRLDYSEKVSLYIVLVFLFWPASYYMIAVYPESLFILLAALSFYFGRRKRWFWAGIVSALLALTKPYGALMMPVLFLKYFYPPLSISESNNKNKKVGNNFELKKQ
jgi:Gpi18-like mannosyltransferase